jgi:hypothetical protein
VDDLLDIVEGLVSQFTAMGQPNSLEFLGSQ